MMQKLEPTPSATETAKDRKRAKAEEQQNKNKWSKYEDYNNWKWEEEDLPDVTAKLVDGGDKLKVEGGKRGSDGCLYQIAGDDGIAKAVAAIDGLEEVCPIWLACKLTGVVESDEVKQRLWSALAQGRRCSAPHL